MDHTRQNAEICMKGTCMKPDRNRHALIRWVALCAALSSALVAGCAAPPVTQTVWVYEQPAGAPTQASVVRWGTVDRIEVVDTRVGVTGAGAATGALVGGVLTSPLGHGGPRGHGPGFLPFALVGVVAGALIGHHIEEQQARASSERHYRVFIDFDDGQTRAYNVADLNGLRVGERVRIERGRIESAH